jgi:hypothetical protein
VLTHRGLGTLSQDISTKNAIQFRMVMSLVYLHFNLLSDSLTTLDMQGPM